MSKTLLLCLPFAGGGASSFHSWQRVSPDEVEILPLQLPGRERRFDEVPLTSIHAAVADLAGQLPVDLHQRRVALFGHSLGAVLAFELAIAIEQTGTVVTRLFASGSPSPYDGRDATASAADDSEFVERVKNFAGYDHPALANPELRELILPVLRADVGMHEAYRADPTRLIDAPITVLRGRDDDLVPAEAVAGWAGATSSGTVTHVDMDGGHMYLTDHSAQIVSMVVEQTSVKAVQ